MTKTQDTVAVAPVPASGTPIPKVEDLTKSIVATIPASGMLKNDEVRRVAFAAAHMYSNFKLEAFERVAGAKLACTLDDVRNARRVLYELALNAERLLNEDIAKVTGRPVKNAAEVEAIEVIEFVRADEVGEQAKAKALVEDFRVRVTSAKTSWEEYKAKVAAQSVPLPEPEEKNKWSVADWRAKLLTAASHMVFEDAPVGTAPATAPVQPDWSTLQVFDPANDPASKQLDTDLLIIEDNLDQFKTLEEAFAMLAQIGYDDTFLDTFFTKFIALLDKQTAQSLNIDGVVDVHVEAWMARAHQLDSLEAMLVDLASYLE